MYTTEESGKSAENLKEMLLIMLWRNHIHTVFQLTSLREMLHPSLRNPKLTVTVNCIKKAVYLTTLRTTPWVSVMTGAGKRSFFACNKLPNWKFSQKEKQVLSTHLPSGQTVTKGKWHTNKTEIVYLERRSELGNAFPCTMRTRCFWSCYSWSVEVLWIYTLMTCLSLFHSLNCYSIQ